MGIAQRNSYLCVLDCGRWGNATAGEVLPTVLHVELSSVLALLLLHVELSWVLLLRHLGVPVPVRLSWLLLLHKHPILHRVRVLLRRKLLLLLLLLERVRATSAIALRKPAAWLVWHRSWSRKAVALAPTTTALTSKGERVVRCCCSRSREALSCHWLVRRRTEDVVRSAAGAKTACCAATSARGRRSAIHAIERSERVGWSYSSWLGNIVASTRHPRAERTERIRGIDTGDATRTRTSRSSRREVTAEATTPSRSARSKRIERRRWCSCRSPKRVKRS